jgi:phosphoribosylamine-glycine ligase
MHKVIQPKVLYFGTPVVLLSTVNRDGTANLAPMSSAWWLGQYCVLGMSMSSATAGNLQRSGECVMNLPSPELVDAVHRPVLRELAERGTPFQGLLYAGLMLTEDGPRALEFNCRFGDPETQAILPRLEGDLFGALAAAATGSLGKVELAASPEAAVTVVLASPGYPDKPETGIEISGVADAEAAGALVFHAGTALRGETLVSAGGRVLDVTATGASAAEARERAYAAVGRIDFPGAHYRRDIAAGAVNVLA